MVCIYCGGKTEIFNSRHLSRINGTWRRRRCLKCGAIITTTEETDYSKQWVVEGKNKRFKPFLRDKLYLSVFNNLGHRKTATIDAIAITVTVISKLGKKSKDGKLSKEDIIDTTYSTLARFDKPASVQYKAYHKS
jgi:transcriptional regulator NrdR family protein